MGKNSTRKNAGTIMNLEKFVKSTLAEDIGRGDLYALVEEAVDAEAYVFAKCDGVMAGQVYVNVLANLEDLEIEWLKNDGDKFVKGDVLLNVKSNSHKVLKTERTLLNMLLHASSIATLTNKYLEIIKPYDVKLLDTRKTRPQLRVFEKYATRCAGAVNHRMGLDDSLMIKDTHLKTIKDLKSYIKKARMQIPFTTKIEVEAETFEIAKEAFEAGADVVMCDNMTPEQIKEIVEFRNKNYAHIILEASGNISLETIESYAKTGVDAISSGALIHQANWIDLSMKLK